MLFSAFAGSFRSPTPMMHEASETMTPKRRLTGPSEYDSCNAQSEMMPDSESTFPRPDVPRSAYRKMIRLAVQGSSGAGTACKSDAGMAVHFSLQWSVTLFPTTPKHTNHASIPQMILDRTGVPTNKLPNFGVGSNPQSSCRVSVAQFSPISPCCF